MKLLDKAIRWAYGFAEDFLEFVSGDLFTDTSADTGASWATTDAAGGILTGVTGATDNNEAYLHTTKELFKFAAGKPIEFEARVQYAEAATDDANVLIGLMDAVGANSLVDDGAGPKASYSGAVFYKVDGGTVWNCETSIGGTQQTTTLSASDLNNRSGVAQTAGGSAYSRFRIEVQGDTLTALVATYFIDDVLVAQHTFDATSATEMMAAVGVKAGGATSETVNVDYITAHQAR